MKKVLLIAAALVAISSVAFAAPPEGYMGIYFDNSHTNWCTTVPAPFTQITYWTWALPSVNGVKCAEFMVAIDVPGNLIQQAEVQNTAIISVGMGTMVTGLSVCFVSCQNEWFWIANQPCYALNLNATVFSIVPTSAGTMQFANCLENYPIEPFKILTKGYLNGTCGPISVQEKSWGAIKSLYN